MKYFTAVLLLALFAVAVVEGEKPKVEVEKVDTTKEAPVDEVARDKRGIVVGYRPLAYSAYSPYAYSGYLPYPYNPYYRYSYPYYGALSIYG